MKLSYIAIGLTFATLSCTAFAEETPTCRWLHLDEETRVYQCVVLAPTQLEQSAVATETLPDPTMPLAEQKSRQLESELTFIPEYLRASLAVAEVEQTEPAVNSGQAPLPLSESYDAHEPTASIPAIVQNLAVMTVEAKQEGIQEAATEGTAEKSTQNSEAAKLKGSIKASSQTRFMVIAVGGVEATRAQLIAENDSEYALVRSSGTLSLGVFSSERSAARRQTALRKIGVESDVISYGTSVSEAPKVVSQSKIEPVSNDLMEYSLQSVNYVKDEPKQQSRVVSGYLVATIGEQKRVLAELKVLGAKDFVALNADPYLNRVSLGVYSSFENALARQEHFKALGIDSELIVRNEPRVVRSTISSPKPREESYGYDQIALRPLDI